MKNTFILIVLMLLLSACYNKIVLVSVDQEAAQTNTLALDKNTLDADDSFEGDSQPVLEVPLVP